MAQPQKAPTSLTSQVERLVIHSRLKADREGEGTAGYEERVEMLKSPRTQRNSCITSWTASRELARASAPPSVQRAPTRTAVNRACVLGTLFYGSEYKTIWKKPQRIPYAKLATYLRHPVV